MVWLWSLAGRPVTSVRVYSPSSKPSMVTPAAWVSLTVILVSASCAPLASYHLPSLVRVNSNSWPTPEGTSPVTAFLMVSLPFLVVFLKVASS